MTCTICGAADARLYPAGLRCGACSPAALAGRTVPVPDPAATLLALRRAKGIPDWPGTNLSSSQLNNDRAIATGKRRSSPREFRDAQAREEERRQAR